MSYKLLVIGFLLGILYGCSSTAAQVPATPSGIPGEAVVKDEPPSPEIEARYEKAKQLYEQKQFGQALGILQKAFASVKNQEQKERVMFLLGEAYFVTNENETAEELYQSFLTQFPKSAHFNEVLAYLYEIGFRFLAGAKVKLWGLAILPARERGRKIICDLVKRYPFSEISEKAQMRQADFFYNNTAYDEARQEYNYFIKTYQRSEFLPHIRFYYADCYLKQYHSPDYDDKNLVMAKEEFQRYLEEYPKDELVAKAQQKLSEISAKEGERDFLVADYYLRTGYSQAARIYLAYIVKNYPETDWAKKAKEILDRDVNKQQ